MPMQMGTLMVTIRAQDFASRTLRRVSAEYTAMSREQKIAMQGDRLAAEMQRAMARRNLVESDRRRLNYVRDAKVAKDTLTRQTTLFKQLGEAQAVAMQGGRFRAGVSRADMQVFQNLAADVKNLGLEGARAAQRYDTIASKMNQVKRITKGQRNELRLASRALRDMIGPDAFARFERFRNAQLAINKAMKDGVPITRAMKTELKAASTAFNALDGVQVKQIQRWDQLNNNVTRYDKTLGNANRGLGRFARSWSVLGTAMARNRQDVIDAHNALDDVTKRQMAYNDAVKKLPLARLDNWGHIMGGVGRTMQLFGAVGTISLGLASKSFADFNKQVTLAATQTRPVGASFAIIGRNADILTNKIMKLMTQFPASAEEMSQAAYDIFSSMDVSFGAGMQLLEKFNKVAVAGGVDLNTATQATISILENFDKRLAIHGQVSQKTNQLMQRMFAIIRFGRMNFAQFNQMLNQVVPAAVGAQQSLDDVSGAMALMTRHMPSQRQAATALARGLDILTDKDFQNGMKKLNLAITDAHHNLLPLPQIVEKLFALKIRKGDLNNLIQYMTAFGRGKGQGRQSTIQARKFWKTMLTNIQEYRTVQSNVVSDNNEMNASFASMSKTMGVRWEVFMNQLKVLILYIGQAAMPVFIEFGQHIKNLIDRWNGLSKNTRDAIVRFAAWAAIGSVLAGVILTIGGALLTFAAAIIHFGPQLTKFAGGIAKLVFDLKGLAALGIITIGVQLLRKGGDWQYIGALLSGFGIGMFRGGMRGGAIGAAIAVSATIAFKGAGWQSKIGQILLGAATGFAVGGGVGALAGGAAATIPILIDMRAQTQSLNKAWNEYTAATEDASQKFAAAQNISVESARKQLIRMAVQKHFQLFGGDPNKIADKDGFIWAKKWMEGFVRGFVRPTPGGPHDATSRFLDMDKSTTKAGTSLNALIKGAKNWTVVQDYMNKKTAETISQMDQLALAIARAFSRGNVSKAQALLQAFATKKDLTPTDANAMKEFMRIFKTGDLQAATAWMQKYQDAVRQSTDDWKQYGEDMKQYRQDVVQYNKDMAQAAQDAANQTLDSMRSMYMDLEQANRQAMGELGKGPWLTSETFDLAKEWGITPQARDLLKDMNMQLSDFRKRNQQLATLAKRGVPAQMLDEIRRMSPEDANPLLQALMKASPGMIRRLARTYGNIQNAIKKQTKIDFTNEMRQFKTAGLNMATALTQGFEQANLQGWFDNWARKLFPGVINAAMSQAVSQFKATGQVPQAPVRPAPRVTGIPTVRATRTGRGGGGGAPDYLRGGSVATHIARAGLTIPTGETYTYNYTFNQTFEHGEAHTGQQIKENAKKAAFHARNATRGSKGGGGAF